jgi:hypothetical protein
MEPLCVEVVVVVKLEIGGDALGVATLWCLALHQVTNYHSLVFTFAIAIPLFYFAWCL